jgi:hypothetical protein
MNKIRSLIVFLTAGYILMFYSEFLFYGEFSPDAGAGLPALLDLGSLWGLYSVMAWLTLAMMHIFRARSLQAVFLVGAIYGWLLEGIVVTTVYEAFPTQVHFTALAWHAPLDVLLGLYLLPRLLRHRSIKPVAAAAACLGIFWGVWATWQWWDTGIPLDLVRFILFSFANAVCLIVAYRLFPADFIEHWQPSRTALLVMTGLLTILFLVQVLPRYLYAILLLPVLLGISFWALWKNRQLQPDRDPRENRLPAARRSHLLVLLIFPATASGVYALCIDNGFRFPVTYIVYVITSLVGIGSFLYSLIHLFRLRRSSPDSASMEKL